MTTTEEVKEQLAASCPSWCEHSIWVGDGTEPHEGDHVGLSHMVGSGLLVTSICAPGYWADEANEQLVWIRPPGSTDGIKVTEDEAIALAHALIRLVGDEF
jgi:hypothetical protein